MLQLIVGYPTESEQNFQETLDFLTRHKDSIDEITSCSGFLLGETRSLMNELETGDYDLVYKTPANWATKYSNPNDRIERLERIEFHLKELNLPANIYFKNQLECIPENERVTASSKKQSEKEISERVFI